MKILDIARKNGSVYLYAMVFLLGALMSTGCSSENTEAECELAMTSFPLQASSEWNALADFKELHSDEEIFGDPALRMEFKALLDAATGSDLVDEVNDKKQAFINPSDGLEGFATQGQLTSSVSLVDATAGSAFVSYSGKTKTPEMIEEIDIVTHSLVPEEALAEFRLLHSYLLDGLFGIGPSDELIETIDEFSGENTSGFIVSYAREIDGLEVVRDVIKLYFVHDPQRWSKGFVLKQIIARWHRDTVSQIAKQDASIYEMDAKKLAAIAFEDQFPELDCKNATASPLHISCTEGICRLSYTVEASSEDMEVMWSFEVDAEDGSILQKTSNTNESYTGTLNIQITKPRESYTGIASKEFQPVPYLTIYDNDISIDLPGDKCTGLVGVGDYAQTLGATDYDGQYTDIDSDNGIVQVDGDVGYCNGIAPPYNCILPVDHSPWHPDDDDLINCDTTSSPFYIYNGTTNLGWNSLGTWNGRLAELKWHVTAATMFAWELGVSTYTPIYFSYHSSDEVGDQNGTCVGKTWAGTTLGNFMRVNCDIYFHIAGHYNLNRSEIDFRNDIFHEFGHTIHNYYGVSVPSGYYSAPYSETKLPYEGFAMYASGIFSTFESEQNAVVGASRVWPSPSIDCSDASCNEGDQEVYRQSSIFTAIFNDFTMTYGNNALEPIVLMLTDVDETTWMVGKCTNDYNWSSCQQIYESSSNTYYRWLLAEATSIEADYEVTKAFHNHIIDSYPRSYTSYPYLPEHLMPSWNWHNDTYINDFPYKDDVTDIVRLAPMISTEVPVTNSSRQAVYEQIDEMPDDFGNQELFFFSTSDDDYFTFIGRENETYTISTLDLSTGVDTVLEVLTEQGTSLGKMNDDCIPRVTTSSCVTFTPTTTALYKIHVYTKPGAATGYTKTYNIKIVTSGDDYADDDEEAHPIQPTATNRKGYVNTSSDQDWFFFILESTNLVGYRMCHETGSSITMAVFDANLNFKVSTSGSTDCNGSDSYMLLAAGTYFVKLSGTTGWYEFHTNFTGDVSSDEASAIQLLAVNVPYHLDGDVILYPTEFEDSADATSEGDYFKVLANQGQTWCFDTIDVDPSIDTTIDLFIPSNYFWGTYGHSIGFPTSSTSEVMFTDSKGGTGDHGSHVCWVVSADNTTVYLRVKGTGIGGYTLAAWSSPIILDNFPVYPGE